MTHTHQAPPTLRLLSLGAGVQSTTLLLLAAHGVIARFDYAPFAETLRSACIGSPLRSNQSRAQMRHTAPAEFQDAAGFDAALRHGNPAAAQSGMPGARTYYLHPSRTPLADAGLGIDTGFEPERCSAWACRGGTGPGPVPGGEYR